VKVNLIFSDGLYAVLLGEEQLSWRMRYPFSVSSDEIDAFVEKHDIVKVFLNKHKGLTRDHRARYLCMFFKWLRLEKGIAISPEDFLQILDKKRAEPGVAKVWGKNLALGFSRDNPAFKGKSVSYRLGTIFTTIRRFCESNEIPLTVEMNPFGEKFRRKYKEPAFTIDFAKKVLGVFSQRDRSVCMSSLQSGQSMHQVLIDINEQANYIFSEIDSGKHRIRFDFAERKGNGFEYFSFISEDAIQEIRKWRVERQQILEQHNKQTEWLWINRQTCEPLTLDGFKFNFRDLLRRHKLWTGPYSARFQMFRKIFEQEASPPDRGISKDYIKFMMGHSRGADNTGLDNPGGTYDKECFIEPAIVEKEYSKLEPFINIYSGKSQEMELTNEELDVLRYLLKKFRENKVEIKP
jgi:hypothetical protein